MKKIHISKLKELFSKIDSVMSLYIPADDESGVSNIVKWHEGVKLSEKLNTVKSVKDVFFPQSESLMEFCIHDKKIDISKPELSDKPFTVFGVRACDVKGLELLDRVFLSEPIDTYYKSRRDNGVMITLACDKPSETCFCGAFGIDVVNSGGDISCLKIDEFLYWKPLTEKGERLTEKLNLLVDCPDSETEAEVEKIRAIHKKLPLNSLSLNCFAEKEMLEIFNSDKWEELSESCLGCGTCTFICPTCQCYDIQEFTHDNKVLRFRCWDSCMYSDFTKMSAGQPRPTQRERFRQRFMHKLCYFPDNNGGIYGCVGCGRCVRKCPISMNIVKVIKTFGEEFGNE